MPEPLQSPYSKINIVDAEGNLIPLGGASPDSATATNQATQTTKLEEIKSELQQIKDNGTPITGAILSSGGSKLIGWLSAIWKILFDKMPALINGRVPVDVASLSVTVSNSQIEIANDVGNPIPVSGNINVANLPATQQISGTVAISNSQIEISNDIGNPIPVNGNVNVANFPLTQQVSGNVNIANLPTTQQVSGTVAISNSQIEIANDVGSPVPIIGNVNVANLPATQQITGAVTVSNQIEIANDVGNPVPVSGQFETKTSAKYWREDFSLTALPNDWTLVQTGAGQSVTVSNSDLQIVSGTTPNTETIIEKTLNLRSDTRVTVGFLFRISSRVPNQEIIFELNDGVGNSAQWIFSGTGGGSANINASNNGFSTGSSTIGNLIDSSNYSVAQIELKDASVEFSNLVINNHQFTRQSVAVRSRQIPGADSLPNLRLRIRVRNLTVAPGSTTTFVDAIYLSETQKSLTDIVGGFGGNSMHNSIPCNVLSMPSPVTYPVNTVFYHTESIFPLGANSAFIGSTRDNRNLSRIVIFCLTDQPGTLFLEVSPDNSIWFVLNPISISANTPFDLSKHIPMRFYRLRYVNGATAQTSLRLYSSQINI